MDDRPNLMLSSSSCLPLIQLHFFSDLLRNCFHHSFDSDKSPDMRTACFPRTGCTHSHEGPELSQSNRQPASYVHRYAFSRMPRAGVRFCIWI
jgi:hypothetical protein